MGGEQPEWLPVGWKVRVRVRSCGKKDKYYVNPSNGLKFCSKPEVLRYLKSSGKDRKPDELDKIDIKKAVAGKLPPGWIKEIRTKKKGSKIRRDPYYIDPVSRRHFRSMQEVFRYLESMDSGEATSNLDDKGHVSVELGDHSQSLSGEAKGQRLIDKRADKSLTGNQSVKSGLTCGSGLKGTAMKNVNTPDDNQLEQREEDDSLATELSAKLQLVNRVKKRAHRMIEIKKLADNRVDKKCANRDQRSTSGSKVAALKKLDMPILEQRYKEDDSVTGNLPNKLPQVNEEIIIQVNGGRRRSMRLADSKQKDNVTEDQSLRSGPEGAAEKIICMPESNDLEQREKENNSTGEGRQHENLACQKKRKNPNSKCTTDLPRRTSKRLACVDVEHPSPKKITSNKSGVSATLSGEAEVTRTKNIGKAGLSDEPQIDDTTGKFGNGSNEHNSKCGTENPTNNQEKPISHDCKEDEKDGKNLDSSLEGLLMDPCIEFAVKTLTGAIPIEEVNKVGESPISSLSSPNRASASSSKLPSGHIWADPCFEFAVKMLTGEMPTEDGSRFHISFQQPVGSSLDNVDRSNYSFDDVKKPCMRQQGVKDPSFPHAVRGSSSNSVGTRRH